MNIFYWNGRNYWKPATKLTVMLLHLLCSWNFLTERMQNLECVFEVKQTTHSLDNYLSGRGLAFCTLSMCILRKLNRFEKKWSLFLNLSYIIFHNNCARVRKRARSWTQSLVQTIILSSLNSTTDIHKRKRIIRGIKFYKKDSSIDILTQ